MGYNTPFTAVAGTAWKAADWNVYGRDNITWVATDSPACRAYNSAAISVANFSFQALTFNSERFDNASVHSTVSNTSRMTVPAGGGGKYLMGGLISFANNTTGDRGGRIRINGSTDVASQTGPPATSGVDTSDFTITTVYSLSAADYAELMAFQVSGGALNAAASSNYSPEFWVFWFRN